MKAKNVPVSAPLTWIQNAASLFFSNFLSFFLMAIVYLVVIFVLLIIPIIGQLALLLLSPILVAGLYTAIRKAKSGEGAKVGDLFTFISHERTGSLVLLSLAPFAFALVVILLSSIFAIGGVGFAGLISGGGSEAVAAVMGGLTPIVFAIVLLSSVLFGIAFSFSVPLVAFENEGVIPALKRAFSAALSNALPLIIFSILSAVLFLIAAPLLGIPLIITAPICLIAFYLAYESIFTS